MSNLFTETPPTEPSTTATEAPEALVSLMQGSGLEPTKQNEIAATLSTFFEYAATWTSTVESLVITDPSETGKMGMARTGRLDLRSKRLEAEKLVDAKRQQVKAAMSEYTLEDKLWLKAGQMMELQFKHLEGKLEEKEKFAERYEAQQREIKRAERLAILAPLGFDGDASNLGVMGDTMFDALKLGLETAKREREEAAQRAIEEQAAKEKAEREERDRIEAENAKLKAEAEAREKQIAAEKERIEKERKELEEKMQAERDAAAKAQAETEKKARLEREKAENERREAEAKAERERLAAQEKAEAEKRALEEKNRKEQAEAQAKIDAERRENERLQSEIRAKEEAERKAKADADKRAKDEEFARFQAEAKAKKAPKKEKLTNWIDGAALGLPPEFNEDPTVLAILQKFDAFKGWAKTQIDAL